MAVFLCEETSVIDTMILLMYSEDVDVARRAVGVMYSLTAHARDVIPNFMCHVQRLVSLAFSESAHPYVVSSTRSILMLLAK